MHANEGYSLLMRQQWIHNELDTSADQPLKSLEWNTEQLNKAVVFTLPVFLLIDCYNLRFFRIWKIMSWRKQEEKNWHSHDVRELLAWTISSGHVECGPGALQGLRYFRIVAKSFGVHLQDTFHEPGIGYLRNSDTFWATSRDDFQSVSL